MNADIIDKKYVCHTGEQPRQNVCWLPFIGHSVILHFFANQSYIVVKCISKMMGYLRPWKRIDLKYVYSLLTDY